jgi:hypothetical protein
MIFQTYLLVLAYLLLGAGLLLVDEYGGHYLLLIRLRNTVGASLWIQLVLIVLGLLLVGLKVFFPVPPGPVLLGDLVPVFFTLVVVMYHATQIVRGNQHGTFGHDRRKGSDEEHAAVDEDMLRKTGSLIELHKRNLGFLILGASALHFMFPGAVLL